MPDGDVLIMRQFKRSTRLAEQMLRDISELMRVELTDNLPGMVTFTRVRLSDDLRHANVYYSYLGPEGKREEAAAYLERERKRIRQLLGSRLRVRHVPELLFKYDPSIEEGIKIERLLNEIKSDSSKQS
jgi:ribosome-binding factor A